tara:strand:- start:1543 stop:2229 length:687 start_codon:yes stop_codon:yes gene_type:complete
MFIDPKSIVIYMTIMRYLMKLALILFFTSSTIFASGKVLHLKGKALINGNNLTRSSVIEQNDIISTKENSLVLLKLSSGATIKIAQNSSLKIAVYKPKSNQTLIHLLKGSSFFKKDPQVKGKLNVKTRVASMGVRGTQFFVSYGKDKKDDVFMCVNKGSVWVSSDKKKAIIVNEGEGVNINSKRKISRPKFLPWTKNLNWSLNPSAKNLENDAKIQEKYGDPLTQDYD